jgi:hypothetical protein
VERRPRVTSASRPARVHRTELVGPREFRAPKRNLDLGRDLPAMPGWACCSSDWTRTSNPAIQNQGPRSASEIILTLGRPALIARPDYGRRGLLVVGADGWREVNGANDLARPTCPSGGRGTQRHPPQGTGTRRPAMSLPVVPEARRIAVELLGDWSRLIGGWDSSHRPRAGARRRGPGSRCGWCLDRRHGGAPGSNALHDGLTSLLDDADRSCNLTEIGREAVLISESGDGAPQ